MQADSRKTFNMKVVGIDEFYNFVNVGWSSKVLNLRDISSWSYDVFYPTLEIFFTSFDHIFLPTSWPCFTKFPFDLAKTHNMKVVDNVSRFPKCPRTQFYHAWARIFEDMKLDIHSWNFKSFYEELKTKSHNYAT